MKKVVYIFIFLFFLSIFQVENYAQCSCQKIKATATDELERADAVFVGEVIDNDNEDNSKTFNVIEIWKGDIGKTIKISRKNFKVGEKWLIYAYKTEDGDWITLNCCSKTKPFSDAEEDIKKFEEKGIKSKKMIEDEESNSN